MYRYATTCRSTATITASTKRWHTPTHTNRILRTFTSATHNRDKSQSSHHRHHVHWRTAAGLAVLSMSMGYVMGIMGIQSKSKSKDRALPSGLPRSCCDCESDINNNNNNNNSDGCCSRASAQSLLHKLTNITGPEHIYTKHTHNTIRYAQFITSMRVLAGDHNNDALCVVQPGSIYEAIECLKVIVQCGAVVVPQGANTGLTGGSVPRHCSACTCTCGINDKDSLNDNMCDCVDNRPAVVLSMRRLNGIVPMDGNERVLCLAGAGIKSVHDTVSSVSENEREGHSVLGSFFLNPTVAAGVALGSGGTQIRKGPVYTDRVLYAKVMEDGRNVELVNTLGVHIDEGNSDDAKNDTNVDRVVEYLSASSDQLSNIRVHSTSTSHGTSPSSSPGYSKQLCDHNGKVARYNGDTNGTDPNRSEGKVLILASVHDTFAVPKRRTVYWVSCDSLESALELRKEVVLANEQDLPLSCEYMDRDSFDVVDEGGRVLCAVIRQFGVGDVVRHLWDLKLLIESKLSNELCDKILYWLNPIFPAPLSRELMRQGQHYDHHLLLEVGDFNDGGKARLLQRLNQFAKKQKITILEVASSQSQCAVQAFRFAAAPAFRTWCVGMGVQGISVDYALPKNDGALPDLSPDESTTIVPIKRMRYSHFGCNVVHEDLAYPLGSDTHSAKLSLKYSVENLGGKLPAEHGHGTEYIAASDAQARWKQMDPSNTMNPGLGGLSSKPFYKTQ